MSVFIDTSAIFAVLDADDQNHTAFAFDRHFSEQVFACIPPNE